jgi:hypothetical protein
MFAALPKMVVDVVKLGLAPIRMPMLWSRPRPIRSFWIAVGFKCDFGVRYHNIKNTARLEYSESLSKEMRDLYEELKVLKNVFAVNVRGAVVWKGPILAKIQLEIGCRVKKINVDPALFRIRTAPEL